MILTSSVIKDLFKALYGEHWASEAAANLGCPEKTVRRWARGETHPTIRYQGKIKRLVDAKLAELERWRSDLCST